MSALVLGGCATQSDADAYLREQGFESITVERDDSGEFQFTATRDGEACEGALHLSGFLGVYRDATLSHVCRRGSPAGAPGSSDEPERPPPGVVALGDDLDLDSIDAHWWFRYRVDWRPNHVSRSAGALLYALIVGDREWIAAHATDELRKTLAERALNLNGVLLVVNEWKIGRARLVSRSDDLEVVEFPLHSHRVVDGADLKLTIEYRGGRYADFEFGGESWDPLVGQYLERQERRLTFLGAWLVADGAVVPGGASRPRDDLAVEFVFDGYRELDGRSVLEHGYTIERDGVEIFDRDYQSETLHGAVPNKVSWRVPIPDPLPGHYEVTFHCGDMTYGSYWLGIIHAFDVENPK